MYWVYENVISGGFAACPWDFEGSKYLGVKFVDTKGNLHYGWVRVTIGYSDGETVTITGYAYESEPNTPITTGVTRGEEAEMLAPISPAASSSSSASLGWLAVGAPGLAMWRRTEQELAD